MDLRNRLNKKAHVTNALFEDAIKYVSQTPLDREIEFLKINQQYPAGIHVRLPSNDRIANGDKIPHTFKGVMWEIIKEKENERRTASE